MNINDFENNFFKKQKSHTDYIIQGENGVCLSSKRLFEIKSHGDTSCLEIALQWVKQAQNNGFCVVVDNEFNCSPELMKKHNIDLSELLYLPAPPPEDLYNILFKLLEYKELRLIVLNSISNLFPLIYDIKEFTEKIEAVQNSNSSILILNPYYNLTYDIFNKVIYTELFTKYIKKSKESVIMSILMKNTSFLTTINYNQI